jgi:hypothetical protein
LNQAKDPNEFLFRDLPAVLQQSASDFEDQDIESLVSIIEDSLYELTNAYDDLVSRLRNILLEELEVPNASPQALADLRERASNISGISGDLVIESFTTRISDFDGSESSILAIASLAVKKPINIWVDQDAQKAMIEIAALSREFRRIESLAHVAGRRDMRQAMSVVVGMDGRQREFWPEFEVKDSDRKAINELISRVREVLEASDWEQVNVVLAALAEITAEYLKEQNKPAEDEKKSEQVA